MHEGRAGGLAHQLPLLLQNAAQVAVNGRKLRHEAYSGHVAVDGLLDQALRRMAPMGRELSIYFNQKDVYDWSMKRMAWCALFLATRCLIGRGCPLPPPSTHTHPTVMRLRLCMTKIQLPAPIHLLPTHTPTHPLYQHFFASIGFLASSRREPPQLPCRQLVGRNRLWLI